jgi:hypothetical protein
LELPFALDPYENDPGWWGASLLNNAELLLTCLDSARASSVVEIGAYAGDLSRLLLLWAQRAQARVTAVDPAPQPELEALARQYAELELVRETSLVALDHIALADAIVLDGDHNYYTVTSELQLILQRSAAAGSPLPLLLAHDVCWPHARRDDYFDPSQIPAEQRQPTHPEGRLYPGQTGISAGGLPYHWPAAREGGPRNGVMTAIEDFVAAHPELALAVVPAFFGLGVVWPREAPYATALQAALAPWDRNPLVERLERNRVLHLASANLQLGLALDAQEKVREFENLLNRMLSSRAFATAELFLRARQRGRPAFSRAEIRRLIGRG